MRAGAFVFSIICLASCGRKEELDVHSCYEEYMCTGDGNIIKWNESSIVFSFEDTTPTSLRSAIKESGNDYNDRFTNTKFNVDENNNSAPPYTGDYSQLNQDGVNAVYYVKSDWPWTTKIPGSLAVTLTRYDSYGIIEADVFVKADHDKYEVADVDSFAWIKYISEHEFGHVLGRSHSKSKDSLMYPSISMSKVIKLSEDTEKQDFFSSYDLELFALAYK